MWEMGDKIHSHYYVQKYTQKYRPFAVWKLIEVFFKDLAHFNFKDSIDDRILAHSSAGTDQKCGCPHAGGLFVWTTYSLTYHLIADRIKRLPAGSWEWYRKSLDPVRTVETISYTAVACFHHSLYTHPLAGPQTVSWWQFSSLPSKTIALISPNSGTSSGPPCIAELSPARSKSWTKLSEYCWTLDTLKTSLNVVITSPLMLLGRQENRKCCLLLGVNDLLQFKLQLTHRQQYCNRCSDVILMRWWRHF